MTTEETRDGVTSFEQAAHLLASRSLVALVPSAPTGDLLEPPTHVAICALDGAATLLLDEPGRALLRRYASRTDRVFVFDEARPALRRLRRAHIDVARPVCAVTLERLAGGAAEELGQIPRDVLAAVTRGRHAVHQLDFQMERLDERGLHRVARLECLVLRAFAALEDRGLPIDTDNWSALIHEAKERERAARDTILGLGGTHIPRDLFGTPEINLDADAEVKTLVARVLGQAVTDVSRSTLASLDHPLCAALLAYRDAHKTVSTYGDSFLSRVDSRTGRIHATFVPLGASTGRVASRDPNLQNLPSDERFHRCLRAPTGHVLVTADYATCELRIVAELAADPVFLEAFARNEDLHSTVATRMFGTRVSKTEHPELRQRAKAINFGLIYGMGPSALAAALEVSLVEGERLLEQYFRTFPRIRDHLESSVEQALRRGYAETVLGRRLVFDADALAAPNARGELGRIAKNMPIQGTSADMTKLAMVRVHERLVDQFADAGLVNTIHDELVVECRAADAEQVAGAVRTEMEDAHRTLLRTVPPLVEVHVGPHWHH